MASCFTPEVQNSASRMSLLCYSAAGGHFLFLHHNFDRDVGPCCLSRGRSDYTLVTGFPLNIRHLRCQLQGKMIICSLFYLLPPHFHSLSRQLKGFSSIPCIIQQFCTTQELINFHREYMWTYDPEPSLCHAKTSAPSQGVTVLLGCLCLMSYSLVFLEVYAKRLCSKICASFFREQEEQRTEYLRRREQNVFTITLGERSG